MKDNSEYGSIISEDDIVLHPQTMTDEQSAMIKKLNRITPFLSMMRDSGMTYPQISEVVEILTGMTVTPKRVRNYIKKFNPPTVKITITDRMPEDGS